MNRMSRGPGPVLAAVVAAPLAVGVLHLPLARAQSQTTPASKLSFEVASIKPSTADSSSVSGIKTGKGRIDAHNVTLKRCIMGAYGIGPHQIAGGPDWLDSDRFMILAKAEQPIDDDGVLMGMLQNLLAERFKLVIHRETRTLPAYVLEVAKNGPKLEKAQPGESGTSTSSSNDGIVMDVHNADMEHFARVLGRQTDLPVVNRTGLSGIFNLKLRWTPERKSARPAGSADEVSLFTALQDQLGLRLRSEKVPIESVVIDRAEKPTEN
jgi:uncharacterized protein (TIGR03435 family)